MYVAPINFEAYIFVPDTSFVNMASHPTQLFSLNKNDWNNSKNSRLYVTRERGFLKFEEL